MANSPGTADILPASGLASWQVLLASMKQAGCLRTWELLGFFPREWIPLIKFAKIKGKKPLNVRAVFPSQPHQKKKSSMKKSFVIALLFLVLLVCAVSAQQENRPAREPNTLMEREKTAGFGLLFDGKELSQEIWDAVDRYKAVDGTIVCDPGGHLLTKKEYGNFVFRFEFKLPPGGNNGVGIRARSRGDAAYNGHEIQILDDTAEQYKDIQPWQAHGSVYRFVPAVRGSLRPVGEWNREEIIAYGNKIKVICNNQVIVDADLTEFVEGKKEPLDGKPHVFNQSGWIGFMGHGDPVAFRSVRIKELKSEEEANQFFNRSPRDGRPRQSL